MYEKKNGVNLKTLWSIILIILLFLPFIFLANAFDNKAGALKFVLKWRSQLSVEKFSSLSLSNNEALLIKHSKYYPLGERGMAPSTRAGKYTLKTDKKLLSQENEDTLIVLTLESEKSLDMV